MQAGKTGTTGILVFDFELFKDSAKMKELATLSGGKLFSDIGRFYSVVAKCEMDAIWPSWSGILFGSKPKERCNTYRSLDCRIKK